MLNVVSTNEVATNVPAKNSTICGISTAMLRCTNAKDIVRFSTPLSRHARTHSSCATWSMVISKMRPSRPDDGRASDNTGRIMCRGEENPLIGSSFHCTATTTSKVTASTNSGRAPRIAMPKMWEVRDFLPATTARIRGHTNSKAMSVATIVEVTAMVIDTPKPESATCAAGCDGSTQLTPKSPWSALPNQDATPSAAVSGKSSSVRIASNTSGSGSRSASRARNTACARSLPSKNGRIAVTKALPRSSNAGNTSCRRNRTTGFGRGPESA